jgi:hypothetical protein
LILGVGTLVASLVFGILCWRWAWGRDLDRRDSFVEDDLAWEDLLQLVQRRGRELADASHSPGEHLPPEKLLQLLLLRPRQEADFLAANPDRRRSPRRWGNPIKVLVKWALWERHGMVINRSEAGLAIFLDLEIEASASLKIRSAEAAYYVPWVEIEVKYSRKVGRNFIIGCQYRKEVPSNVRAWFA